MPTTATPATNTRARSASTNRRPHPNLAALKERAFALACTGLRSPAIALRLHVPERTIRRWVNDTLLSLAQDALDPDTSYAPDTSGSSGSSAASGKSNDPNARDGAAASANDSGSPSGDAASPGDIGGPATRPTLIPLERHRALAIESQRAVAATAHAAYDRLMARHDDLLDSLTTILRDSMTSVADSSAAPAPLPPAAALLTRLIAQLEAGATHHLRIAQTAHRDAARFQGVTAYAQTDARLTATEAHAEANAEANAEPDDDAEQEGGLVPIKWVDPNAPKEVGLIPRSTFDANAAIDELCSGPVSALDKLKQTNNIKSSDDDDDDEQDEGSILAAIIAEQVAGDALAAAPAAASSLPSATGPATSPATGPATNAATSPATPLDERRSPYPTTGETASESAPEYLYEERQRLSEERRALLERLARTRYPPLTLPRSNTIGAFFMRNPRYVF